LELIKNANLPISTLKRQFINLVQDSYCLKLSVKNSDPRTGEYCVILKGKLEPQFVMSS